jgi:hypothetical protein
MTAGSTVPGRREWRPQYLTGPKLVYVEVFEFFGWRVGRHCMPAGAQMQIRSASGVPRSSSPNLTLYTMGRIAVTGNDGTAFDDRVPGMYSAERPDHPPGVVTLQALQDSEFWCFNHTANRRTLPSLQPIRLVAGQQVELAAGQRLVLFRGDALLDGQEQDWPSSLIVPADGVLTAVTAVFGVIVEAERAA